MSKPTGPAHSFTTLHPPLLCSNLHHFGWHWEQRQDWIFFFPHLQSVSSVAELQRHPFNKHKLDFRSRCVMIYASSSIMDAMLRKRSCIYCTGDGKNPKIHLFRGAFACSTWAQCKTRNIRVNVCFVETQQGHCFARGQQFETFGCSPIRSCWTKIKNVFLIYSNRIRPKNCVKNTHTLF